ncbi:beta-N-acetylglucosaminidase domain-containing protein [Tumebacillus sp. ITR2]|uniref:Beta-N-acetylglucosaminidase domain-containing protein n=1 Tax=Tumebacillus amylolyticus TaxID=2801339 RepID=A0ABS1J4Q0_9BACL|nr:protein O-GlcNAcase [Tumebacillus amylolyticus]MBL0385251.1 beta-N-acetylglucosaminidase domain-containing protein [Tumebacillus amylolyticus]
MKARTWMIYLSVVALVVAGLGWYAADHKKTMPSLPNVTPNSQTSPSKPAPPTPAPSQDSPASSDIRGVIEGFYGDPWTLAQRKSMLQFMGEHHFNTYVYAPKDDPYQRKQWSRLYPASNLHEMQSLVQSAETNNIHFVYSLSPGLPAPLPGETSTSDDETRSITYSSPSDRDQLAAKIDQLRSIGVHDFLLSFDDVQETLKPADQTQYGTNIASAHITLANDLYQREHTLDPTFHLWFAPTTYYGVQDNPYWQTLRANLDPAIPVIWTGNWVLNPTITSAQAETVTHLLGRKPLLWDNYPVNDYTYVVKKAPQLFLGPLVGRDADLPGHLSGYIANPQLQEEASKVALSTISDYLQNPSGYQPTPSWKNATATVGGIGDPAAWQLFCSYAQESTLRTTSNPEFVQMTRDYWNAPNPQARATAESRLRAEFQNLAALPTRLSQTVRNPDLLTEINPWLTKLASLAQVDLTALDSLNDPQNATLRQHLQTQIRGTQSSSYKIGTDLLTFAQQAAAH